MSGMRNEAGTRTPLMSGVEARGMRLGWRDFAPRWHIFFVHVVVVGSHCERKQKGLVAEQ